MKIKIVDKNQFSVLLLMKEKLYDFDNLSKEEKERHLTKFPPLFGSQFVSKEHIGKIIYINQAYSEIYEFDEENISRIYQKEKCFSALSSFFKNLKFF